MTALYIASVYETACNGSGEKTGPLPNGPQPIMAAKTGRSCQFQFPHAK